MDWGDFLFFLAGALAAIAGTAALHRFRRPEESGAEESFGTKKREEKETERRREKPERDRTVLIKRIRWGICGVLILALGLWLWVPSLFSVPASRRINGLEVRVPEGFTSTYSDGHLFIWKYTGNDKNPGPLILNTEINGSWAQYFTKVEEVLEDCEWIRDPEIYVNPEGIRTVRGYSMDYSAGGEYRYYVETPKSVLLISMNVNEQFYRLQDCLEALQETVDQLKRE